VAGKNGFSRREKEKIERGYLPRRQHHHHLTAFHLRVLLDLGEDIDVLLDAVEQFHAQMLMRHFAAAEAQGHLHLVAFVEEALHRLHLRFVIVIVDGRAHLDFFELDDLLLLARFGGLLLLLVFVFAEIHQLDDGRLRLGRNLDQVEAFFLGDGAAFVDADLAVFVPVVPDQEDGAGKNLFIDAGAILRRRRGGLLETLRGGYDSLLLERRAAAPRGICRAPRNEFRSGVAAELLEGWRAALVATARETAPPEAGRAGPENKRAGAIGKRAIREISIYSN